MNAALVRAMEAGHVPTFRKVFGMAFAKVPHVKKPANDREAEIVMHLARTSSSAVAFRHRAYSHRFLTERNLPSQLPETMKPKAERMFPKIVQAVGIASLTAGEGTAETQAVMRNAVLEVYGDMPEGVNPDPAVVRERVLRARAIERRALMLPPPSKSVVAQLMERLRG